MKLPRVIFMTCLSLVVIATLYYHIMRVENTSEALFSDILIRDLPQIHQQRPHEHSDQFGIPNLIDYRAYNPSVAYSSSHNQLIYAYRVSNYTLCREKSNPVFFHNRSKIKSFIIITTEDGRSFVLKFPTQLAKSNCVQGYEDPRIFIHSNKVYVVANLHTRQNCDNQMFLLSFPLSYITTGFASLTHTQTIIPNMILPLETDNPADQQRMQKNWMPFVNRSNGQICFVYSVNPHIILQCDEVTGECKTIAKTHNPNLPSGIRGGSQIQFYKGQYIAFTHKREANMYRTQIYAFAPEHPYNVTHITDDFMFATGATFGNLHIQFVSGFDIRDDIAYVTYGEQDCHAKVCEIPMKRILAALKPISK